MMVIIISMAGHGLDTKLFDYEVVEELGQVKLF